MTKILVTGGLGYIGSYCVIKLIEYGYTPIIIDKDNNIETLYKIKQIVKKDSILFYNIDLCNINDLEKVFINESNIKTVIHFAAYKSVSESMSNSSLYYLNNINSTTNLLYIMNKYNCNNLIYSSSATVYGNQQPPFNENMTTGINLTNPYGFTKKTIEDILEDHAKYNKEFKVVCLRYFNPVGTHHTGILGESIDDSIQNLMPNIIRTFLGKQECLYVYGNDYKTFDGSCIRDYIHIDDLIEGHILCLKSFNKKPQFKVYNLGSGRGYSVFEIIDCISLHFGKFPVVKSVPARKGDIPISISDITKIKNELGWYPLKTLDDICKDTVTYINQLKE